MARSFDSSVPDAALVRAIRRRGSETAFGILYDRHTPGAFRTAWRLVGGSRQDAEDAMQDAWVRAIGALHSWDEGRPFGTWLRGIVTHAALDLLRKRGRFTAAGDTPCGGGDTLLDRLDLEAAIASLAPGYRLVLVLHDIEGFTHDEIAARLGITAGTSKGQLFKARRALRARLTCRLGDER